MPGYAASRWNTTHWSVLGWLTPLQCGHTLGNSCKATPRLWLLADRRASS
jgi:hypothetical protein